MSVSYFKISLPHKVFWYVRTDSGKFFDITGCEPLTNGRIDECDGLLLSAKEVSPQFVADLVAEAERRNGQLQTVETLLREWIKIRRARVRRAKQRLSIQKKEVVN